jgi:hypothetical protein
VVDGWDTGETGGIRVRRVGYGETAGDTGKCEDLWVDSQYLVTMN